MILYQRKEGDQISVQLCLQYKQNVSYITYLEYLKRLGYQGRVFQKHRKCIPPAVHAQILDLMGKIPP